MYSTGIRHRDVLTLSQNSQNHEKLLMNKRPFILTDNLSFYNAVTGFNTSAFRAPCVCGKV